MSKAAILIPIYTCNLQASEWRSLAQCASKLGRHDIVVVHPHGLDTSPLLSCLPTMRGETFAPEYFQNIEGYNRLMLSQEFYEKFLAYDYILIFQTDAWVFSDKLEEWCAKGYDYIGAPWIPNHLSPLHGMLLHLRCLYARLTGHNSSALRKWRVGNGGLSLRRPQSMLRMLQTYPEQVPASFKHLKHNEDVFWSITMRRHLRIPSWQEALEFAVESQPEWALRRMGHLPFGCHGWNKEPFSSFWKNIICKEA